MANIKGAVAEEALYIKERMSGVDSNLKLRLEQYGYNDLQTFFDDKREYLFSQWVPEVRRIKSPQFAQAVEAAIKNREYGVYICSTDGVSAYHGTDEIDYDLCENLGIEVIELNYRGGTIIANSGDLGIEVVMPKDIGMRLDHFNHKIAEILSRYIEGAEMSGNDILVNGDKVMGAMSRLVGDVFVWAAQISFTDASEYISKVCSKKSTKKPGYIKSELLTKDIFESEVLTWLQKR